MFVHPIKTCLFLVAKPLYNYLCPSVCMSGLGGNVIFSDLIQDRALIFCVHIPFVYEHIFFKYFVRWSVGHVSKDRNVKKYRNEKIIFHLNDSLPQKNSYMWNKNNNNYFCINQNLFYQQQKRESAREILVSSALRSETTG